MPVTKEQIVDRLRQVNDPELHKDLVTLNMVKNVAVCEGTVRIEIELTTPACPLKDAIHADVVSAVKSLDGVTEVNVDFSAAVRSASGPAGGQQGAAGAADGDNPLAGVKHIIAVGSGKGGVGKSTVSVNVAVGLARAGANVGLVDADIYGPSIPTLLGLEGMEPRMAAGNMLVPFEAHGIKTMSIGMLVETDKALILRGPMAQSAFRQLALQTAWGELDYLIIDLPPGTGDVPLTMAQMLTNLTGAVVVCTPQKVAQDDARRAVAMFNQLNVPVLGVVENMSYFIGDDGKEYDIFGKGGAQYMAHEHGVPYLGGIPINMRLRANSDAGNPTANFEDDKQLGGELDAVVKTLAGQISVAVMAAEASKPTLSIS